MELEQLDLFCISEFKLSSKGIELKFFDRQKAFELLYTIASSADAGKKERSFYDALEKVRRCCGIHKNMNLQTFSPKTAPGVADMVSCS